MKNPASASAEKIILLVALLAVVGLTGGGVWAGDEVLPGEKIIDPQAPVIGPAGAKAVIVEFADFQCPYCAVMARFVEQLQESAPQEIRVVWMDRPLDGMAEDGFAFHPYAMIAHEAAAEAQAQGKFWEMQQWIFLNQASLFPRERPRNIVDYELKLRALQQRLTDAGSELGLDKIKMRLALTNHLRRKEVSKRLTMAKDLEIYSTPTVFVNGVNLGYDPAAVKSAVEQAVGRSLF